MAEMPQNVASVYKELIDGLRSMKQQQWTTTNYAILLLAAVYALSSRGSVSYYAHYLTVIIAAVGSFFLLKIQYDIAQSRARLDTIEARYFTDTELEDTGLTREEINDLRNQTFARRIEHYRRGWEF